MKPWHNQKKLLFCCEARCLSQKCGNLCEGGVCDGKGFCTDPIMNPCSDHGCEGRKCGDECLLGDITGLCDLRGICQFSKVFCGKYCIPKNVYIQ